jgi:16S rRNA G1207 methylase RsmC
MPHYYEKKQTSQLNIQKIPTVLRGSSLDIYSASGIFSKSRIDKGSMLLANTAIIEEGWKVLDFGCGYGVIGVAIAKSFPSCKVLMSDINKRAVMMSKKNIDENKLKNASAIQSDMFEKIHEEFNTILLNPPQSAGKELCIKMIEQAKEHLLEGGLFQMVARHNIGGRELEKHMLRIYGNVREIAKRSGYRIYVSEKA